MEGQPTLRAPAPSLFTPEDGHYGYIYNGSGRVGEVRYTFTKAQAFYQEMAERREASNEMLEVLAGGSASIGAGVVLAPVAGTAVARGTATVIGRVAAAGSGTGVVLGSYEQPKNYLSFAKDIGANAFNLPTQVWQVLNFVGQTWTANKAFIDASLAKGHQIYLATSPLLNPGEAQSFQRELAYLKSIGVDATKWIMLRY